MCNIDEFECAIVEFFYESSPCSCFSNIHGPWDEAVIST